MASAEFEAEIFEELAVRFVLNCPREEFQSFERLCFQLEEAHWFYLDFCREDNHRLPNYNLTNFVKTLFKYAPPLRSYIGHVDAAVEQFREYKIRVPVCGVIILNTTLEKVLLVKGWTARSAWGFPRGKINKNERPQDCAAREAMEETGFDVSTLIDPNNQITINAAEQFVTMFIVPYVSEETAFAPRARKEISDIQWYYVGNLPAGQRPRSGEAASSTENFFYVSNFVKPLIKWIRQKSNSPDADLRRQLALEASRRTREDWSKFQAKQTMTGSSSSPSASTGSSQSLSSVSVPEVHLHLRERSKVASQAAATSSAAPAALSLPGSTTSPRRKVTEAVSKNRSPLLTFKFDREPILKCFA